MSADMIPDPSVDVGSGARITTLDNGIRVASDLMPSVESVSLGAWFGVGTRHEKASENGVAHLLEHMAFKGTKRRSATAIAEEIEAVGGHLNAYTSREQTAYYAKVLKEDVALAVDVLADILQHSVFDEEELGRERSVVLQEIGQAADTPDDIIFDLFQETAFPDQPVGWPVLGRADIVSAMPRRAIADFVGENYGGESMVFAASGKIEHEALVEAVRGTFGDLPSRSAAVSEPAVYAGGDCREERDLEQVHLILGFRGVAFDDPDFYTQQVFSMLFGGGMSSRLFQEVREKRGLVYSVYSFASSYRDDGLFGIYAGTGEKEVGELVPIVCDQLGAVAHDVTEEEVQRARTQLKSGLLMSREGTSNRCEQLAQHLLVYGHPLRVDELVSRIEAVDEAAVRRFVSRLTAGAPTVAAVGPLSSLESHDRITARLHARTA
jgi:predicted Zn-dependent peptidase